MVLTPLETIQINGQKNKKISRHYSIFFCEKKTELLFKVS